MLHRLLAAAVCFATSGDTWQPSHCVNAPPPKTKSTQSTHCIQPCQLILYFPFPKSLLATLIKKDTE